MNLLLSWGVLALGAWLATAIIPAVKVRGGIGSYFVVAALFGGTAAEWMIHHAAL